MIKLIENIKEITQREPWFTLSAIGCGLLGVCSFFFILPPLMYVFDMWLTYWLHK